MSRTQPRTDVFRAWVSVLIVSVVAVGLLAVLTQTSALDMTDPAVALIVAYIVVWPLYTAMYVGWGVRTYTTLDTADLGRLAGRERRTKQRWTERLFGTGATATTVTAATVAVVVTVVIAQQPEFRGNTSYIALGLLTVASSWVLMVYAFAQAYLYLATEPTDVAHLQFAHAEEPRFGDYVTLAVLVSTMAATVSAQLTSRAAWRLVRVNVVIAFAFNSVIIAMVVSLLFAGLTS